MFNPVYNADGVHRRLAEAYIDWPHFPRPARKEIVFSDGCGNSTVVQSVALYDLRRDERRNGIAVLNWERPAQNKLGNGKRVFANGQYASMKECTADQN